MMRLLLRRISPEVHVSDVAIALREVRSSGQSRLGP
jgi:hypothetical protein